MWWNGVAEDSDTIELVTRKYEGVLKLILKLFVRENASTGFSTI